jgi:hypothetical protein
LRSTDHSEAAKRSPEDERTGVISFDEDGSGSKKAVEIVVVKKGLALTANDFFLV